MATVQDLKRRIRSVGNTQKITKAFELVASARLRRAEARIEAMRPYADRMLELMGVTARAAGSVRLPLLERRDDVHRVALLPITADRGLAGAFNAQVLRRAFALERELRGDGLEVKWLATGRRGRSTLTFRGYDLIQVWQGFSERPEYADAQAIARKAAELYANEEVDRVVVVYNRFKSALVQEVTVQDLLPIPEKVIEGDEKDAEQAALRGDFIYEPEPEQILERLLPVYVETELYRALLESAASEQGARMTAMRNASSNAGDKIAILSGGFIVFLVFVAIAGGPIAAHFLGHGPNDLNLSAGLSGLSQLPVGPLSHVPCSGFAAPPSGCVGHPQGTQLYILGADGQLGNDEFLRLLYGARVSLEVAVLSTIGIMLIGILLGTIAGYYRGWIDTVISRVIELTMVFPALLFIIALSATVGPRLNHITFGIFAQGVVTLVLVFSLPGWFY